VGTDIPAVTKPSNDRQHGALGPPLSSGCRVGGIGWRQSRSESLVDGAGDAALEGPDGLAGPIALGAAPLIIGLAWAGQAQLGDGDAVQGGVQLPVATT
jgi:hypothetical protein